MIDKYQSEYDHYQYVTADSDYSAVYTGFSEYRRVKVYDYDMYTVENSADFICGLIDQFTCEPDMLEGLALGLTYEINLQDHTINKRIDYPMFTDNFPSSDGYWISPKGEVFNVGYVGHQHSSQEIIATYYGKHYKDVTNSTVDYLEGLGWIHVSGSRCHHYQPFNDRQYDVLSTLKEVAMESVKRGIEYELYAQPEA